MQYIKVIIADVHYVVKQKILKLKLLDYVLFNFEGYKLQDSTLKVDSIKPDTCFLILICKIIFI